MSHSDSAEEQPLDNAASQPETTLNLPPSEPESADEPVPANGSETVEDSREVVEQPTNPTYQPELEQESISMVSETAIITEGSTQLADEHPESDNFLGSEPEVALVEPIAIENAFAHDELIAEVELEPDTADDAISEEENRAMLEMFLKLPPLEVENGEITKPQSLADKALAAIDMDGLLETLNEWVSIQSLDGTPAENIVQERVADTMRHLGLSVEMWEFNYDDVQEHPSFCVEVPRPRSIGVVGRYGLAEEEGRSLILNGHTDVVPVGDIEQWTVPPWEATVSREENRVYGRGALDMKGNLACGLYAIKAIRDAGIALEGEVLLQSVVGEEDGGVGTLAAIVRGYTADAAIVLEPTELMIAPAQAGALNFRVTIPGYPAHGAMRNEGVDPLEKFMLVYQAILTYEKVRNTNIIHPLFQNYDLPYPICVGTIQGGNWASTVAESLTFEGRLGVAVGEDVVQARLQFEELISKSAMADLWLRQHPPTVEWWGGQFAPAEIEADHALVKTLGNCLKTVTSQEPTVQGVTYGADMRLLVNDANIPTVLFGAGDVRKAHQFDEYVPLNELETVVKTITLTILDFCGIKTESNS